MSEVSFARRNRLLLYLTALVASWVAFTVVGESLGYIYMIVPVPSSEDCICYTAFISWGRTLSFLLMGSVGSILLYLTFREVVSQPPETRTAARFKLAGEVTFIFFFFLFLSGLAMRYTGNELHAYTSLTPPATLLPITPQANTYFLVYFFDEVLGHKLIYLGIVGFIVSVTILQNYHGYTWPLKRADYALYGALGFLFGAGIGASSVEGQAAFEIIIFSASSFSVMAYFLATKRMQLVEKSPKGVRSNPFYAFSLLFLLGLITAILACGAYFGLKPFYPFFTQPSEESTIIQRIILHLSSQ
ncbi:MAG: hypothetical protein KIH01_07285 [Candidatus Freyarchaeota archaeon]|nr:hypothetical protein [Candidatus Jordarchaeia archaeon]